MNEKTKTTKQGNSSLKSKGASSSSVRLNKSVKFMEELSWLLDRYSDVNFKEFSNYLENFKNYRNEFVHFSNKENYLNEKNSLKNPNRSILVGVLPELFIDSNIFQSNEEISEFAEKVLRVSIPNWEKKSKFELIGHIVCNTSSANDRKLEKIAKALRLISDGNVKVKRLVAKSRKDKKGWNEIIQQLIDGS